MIGDDGAIEIAVALRRNTSLLCLDLSLNEIGDNGAMALVSALHINNSLKALLIMVNPISNEKIYVCLSRNSDICVTVPTNIYLINE